MTYEFVNGFMHVTEAAALIIAAWNWYFSQKASHLIILFYLLLVCIVEIYGSIPSDNNIIGYNIFESIHVLIIYTLYFNIFKQGYIRSIIAILFVAFLCTLCWELNSQAWSLDLFLSTTFGLTSLSAGLLAIYYITYTILQGQTEKSTFTFWVSIGFVIYYFCNLPYTVLSNILENLDGGRMLRFVQPLSGIALYTSISLGYLWKKSQ